MAKTIRPFSYMTPLEEGFLRAYEAYKEAWQMALDLNQPAETRREWEAKRDEAHKNVTTLNFRLWCEAYGIKTS